MASTAPQARHSWPHAPYSRAANSPRPSARTTGFRATTHRHTATNGMHACQMRARAGTGTHVCYSDGSIHSATCASCTACSAYQYETSACQAGGETSDRTCASCTVCSGANSYEVSPCTANANRICAQQPSPPPPPPPPPSPPPPSPPPSTPPPMLCSDTCLAHSLGNGGAWANNSFCQDGGDDSTGNTCAYGTDCTDCGP
eukprot:scaffold75754_cov75-Phaeocystis_antarctica.AAC.1